MQKQLPEERVVVGTVVQVLTLHETASDLAKTFDLFGWFAPCTILVRIILHDLWKLKLAWDDPVLTILPKFGQIWKMNFHSSLPIQYLAFILSRVKSHKPSTARLQWRLEISLRSGCLLACCLIGHDCFYFFTTRKDQNCTFWMVVLFQEKNSMELSYWISSWLLLLIFSQFLLQMYLRGAILPLYCAGCPLPHTS